MTKNLRFSRSHLTIYSVVPCPSAPSFIVHFESANKLSQRIYMFAISCKSSPPPHPQPHRFLIAKLLYGKESSRGRYTLTSSIDRQGSSVLIMIIRHMSDSTRGDVDNQLVNQAALINYDEFYQSLHWSGVRLRVCNYRVDIELLSHRK